MENKANPRLPFKKNWTSTGKDGNTYIVDVSIEQTSDIKKYPPDGKKAVFRVFRIYQDGEKELVVLIDNHEPFGFHEHDELPDKHEPRKEIHASDWQEAYDIFDKRFKELFK